MIKQLSQIFALLIILVIVLPILLSTNFVEAATSFSDGFESGNFKAWTGTGGAGSYSAKVETSHPTEGKYDALFTVNKNNSKSYTHKDGISFSTTLSFKSTVEFFNSQAMPRANGQEVDFNELYDSRTGQICRAAIRYDNNSLKWGLLTGKSGALKSTWENMSSNPTVNTVYFIFIVVDKINSQAKLYVDGALKVTVSMVIKASSFNVYAGFMGVYTSPSGSFKIAVDQVEVSSKATPTPQPSYSQSIFSSIYCSSQAKGTNSLFATRVVGNFSSAKFSSNITGTAQNETVIIKNGWLNVTKTIPNSNAAYYARFYVANTTNEFVSDSLFFVPQNDSMLLKANGRWLLDGKGNVMVLHSVNKVEMADDPDGAWMDDTYWNATKVSQEIGIMKSWGVNTIRLLINVEDWKYNNNAPYAAEYARNAIKRVIEIAHDKGMYVCITNFRVTNYWHGGNQDPLPYPPYQTSTSASSIINSQQQFIDYCASIGQELRVYSNVLFEIWNEPFVDNAQAFSSWINVTQNVVTAMRNVGFNAPIICQWDRISWTNLDYPQIPHGSMNNWVETLKPRDVAGNIVFSTHAYRQGNSFFHGTTENKGYTLQDLTDFYSQCGIYNVSQYYPVYISETGVSFNAENLTQEIIAQTNMLQLSKAYSISIGQHWFRNILEYRMRDDNFNPTAGGQVFINAFNGTGT